MKKIVKGNDFTLRIPVMKMVEGQAQAFPLPACTDVVVQVCNQFRRIPLAFEIDVKEDNVILARVEGDKMSLGTYAVEVRGKIFGNDWRSNEYPQFSIVAKNADADTEFGETDEGDNSVEMDTAMVILPPSVELSDLISDTNEALGKVDGAISKTDEAVKKANDAVSQVNGALEKVQNVDIDLVGTDLNITRPSGEEKEFDLMQLKGDKGERGEKGDKGNAFTFADFTPEELASLKGEKGEKGEKGDKGDKGLQGERGEKGDMGSIGKISISVDNTTGTPSATATASKAADGSTDISFSFKGIKGEKGEKGERGEQGLQGIQGLQGERGERGLPGNDGAKGDKGEAFKYTDFTEEQLAALKGDKGDIGLTGPQGETGPVGPQGVKGDPFTYSDFTEAQIKELQKPATDAANKAQEILKNAEIAINGAETVNAKLENYILSVTDREGNTNEINLNADETVNLTITSLVEGIKVAGMKVNVYLNNGKIPTTYTTDSNGHVTFNVERGTLYRIEFNEYGNAQPISPISYTATSGMVREISVEYKPYDGESSEKVIVTVTKYTDGVGSAWEGIPVTITYDGNDSVTNTDSNGHVIAFVPFGKEYSVKVEDTDGYYVNFYRNTRTYRASLPERAITYNLYQYKTGIFVLDANKGEYTIDEWTAAGKSQDDAVAIKIADINLYTNKGTFAIRTSDIKNIKQVSLPSKSYCTQSIKFNSIATNGNDPKDPNYYNGEISSFLIRQEAQERGLNIPAFDYAYNQMLTLSGENLHGAIGSVGQFVILAGNLNYLEEVVTKLYNEEIATALSKKLSDQLWTSTQKTVGWAWTLKNLRANDYSMQNSYYVLPFFAC